MADSPSYLLILNGQRIATALHGGARWDWVPFLLLWIGLAAGGALGALMFLRLGVAALWFAAAVVCGQASRSVAAIPMSTMV